MESIRVLFQELFNVFPSKYRGGFRDGNVDNHLGQVDLCPFLKVKQSVWEAIELIKAPNDPRNIPALLKEETELVFNFDAESLLNYYKGIFTNSALERLTGINQKQLQHYSTGYRKPREVQRKKIEKALHNLGEELLAVEL